MSKDFLLEQIKALVPNEYSIELYFLKLTSATRTRILSLSIHLKTLIISLII